MKSLDSLFIITCQNMSKSRVVCLLVKSQSTKCKMPLYLGCARTSFEGKGSKVYIFTTEQKGKGGKIGFFLENY